MNRGTRFAFFTNPGMNFKDHFSAHAAQYAAARPGYPPALFDWLATRAPDTALAWDAGCGNGQAALGLAGVFTSVYASDPSQAQIRQAPAHARVRFVEEAAEACSLDDASVDLVTVAQALHWFDLPGFYAQVRRVLRREGVIAVWSYALSRVDPGVDAVFDRLYDGILDGYWPPERRHVESGYAALAFPFDRLPSPAFDMQSHWTLADYLAYLRSWSATQRYLRERGVDPVALVAGELAEAWGAPSQPRPVRWPLTLRVGVHRAG